MKNKRKETIPEKIVRVFTTRVKSHWTSPARIAFLVFGNSGALFTRSFLSSLYTAKRLLEDRRLGVVVNKLVGAKISAMRLATVEDKPSTEEELLRCKRRLEGQARTFVRKTHATQVMHLLPAAQIQEIAPVKLVRAFTQHLLGDGS